MSRSSVGRSWHPYADLILTNANVIAVDARDTRAQAVAIKDGRIVALGAPEAVAAARGPQSDVLDLRGRTVIPGLIDGHAHHDREGLRQLFPSLAGARSIDDILARVRELAHQTPKGEWIVTMPIGEPPHYFAAAEGLAEGRYPTRWELDRAAPDHPVYLRGIWGYWRDRPPIVSVANSAALARCGIGRDTQPPCSTVEIERDPATGEPTGVFREHFEVPVLEFTLFRAVPRFTHAQRVRGLRGSIQRSHAAGTTSIYEGHGLVPEVQAAYLELHAAGELTMRTHLVLSPTWSSVDEAEQVMDQWLTYATGPGLGDEWLRLGGVFVRIGGREDVAAIVRAGLPYTGWAGFAEQAYTPEEFRALAFAAARRNLRLNTIVSTPDTLRTALDTLEAIDRELPIRQRRLVLIHVSEASREAIERMRRLGVVATTQPANFLWKRGGPALASGADPERLLPHRDFLELGLPFALSTDNNPYNAFWALWAAVERTEREQGRVVGAGQRISPLEALRALTRDAARLTFEESVKGSIEVGKLADLAVLADDPLAVPPARLRDLQVQLTLVGGRVVYCADPELLPTRQRDTAARVEGQRSGR
ncbi:MAG: amidohydrolase [Chloroflexi bacterium]|nr:amidohydrolase [Chloroflexota bacterium]